MTFTRESKSNSSKYYCMCLQILIKYIFFSDGKVMFEAQSKATIVSSWIIKFPIWYGDSDWQVEWEKYCSIETHVTFGLFIYLIFY